MLAFAGCSSSTTTSPSASTGTFINGTVTFNRSVAVPSNARILVLWQLSPDAGPSNTYFESVGAVDTSGKTFVMTLPQSPPASAIYQDSLGRSIGAGIVVLTSDAIVDGIGSIDSFPRHGTFFGAINNTLIVFKKGDPSVGGLGNWPSKFPQGYSFGMGQPASNGSDTLALDRITPPLLIDTSVNSFHMPNWD